MTGSRRRQHAAVRGRTIAMAMFLCAAASGMGVVYVQKTQEQHVLGRQMTEVEDHIQRLERDLLTSRTVLAQLTSPQVLKQRVRDLGLGLTNVTLAQRLFLPPPLPQRLPPAAPQPEPAEPAPLVRPAAPLAVAGAR